MASWQWPVDGAVNCNFLPDEVSGESQSDNAGEKTTTILFFLKNYRKNGRHSYNCSYF